jgi:N-methylhydantoinase A
VRLQAGRAASSEEVARVAGALASARREVTDNLSRAGISGKPHHDSFAAVRFRGQTHHLDVPICGERIDAATMADAISRFQTRYDMLFGRGAAFAAAGHEILSIRVTGSGALPPPPLQARGDAPIIHGLRDVVFDDPSATVSCTIWRTDFPAPGSRFVGPCIVEYPGQSAVLPPGATGEVDSFGNLHVRLTP